MYEHYITPALGSSCVTESSPHQEWMLKAYGSKGKEENTALEGLECACLLHVRSAGLPSSDSAYGLHMPQTNWYGHRHLADNSALQATFSSVEKQIQLFLPTILLNFQLLKCFFFECKFLGVMLYSTCKWSWKVQIHKVITVSGLSSVSIFIFLLAHQHACDPMGHAGVMGWASC